MQEHNEVPLNRSLLLSALHDLSARLFQSFGAAVHLVVHGGAVMVLHQSLSSYRRDTRDVDYCHRSFISEWEQRRGVLDAGNRLHSCIAATAHTFRLGADWMNAHADVALPMALDKRGKLIDPIYNDAMTQENVAMNTVFSSVGLVLIGVTWSWAVALKLVRYQKDDPSDIAAILSLGYKMKGLQWTRQVLEDWLLGMCSPMGYTSYPPQEIQKTRDKMRDAVARAQTLLSRSAYVAPQTQTAVQVPVIPPQSMLASMGSSTAPHHLSNESLRDQFDHDQGQSSRARSRSRSRVHSTSGGPFLPTLPPSMPVPSMIMPSSRASSRPPSASFYAGDHSTASRSRSHSRPPSRLVPAMHPSIPPLPQMPSFVMPPSNVSSRHSSVTSMYFAQHQAPAHSSHRKSASISPTPIPVQSIPPGFVPFRQLAPARQPMAVY